MNFFLISAGPTLEHTHHSTWVQLQGCREAYKVQLKKGKSKISLYKSKEGQPNFKGISGLGGDYMLWKLIL